MAQMQSGARARNDGRINQTAAPAVDGPLLHLWLYCLAAMVLAMVVVGGATRLTDSGLSITEWQPIVGMIPPLSAADWQDAFSKYKLIPQYHLVNEGMSLAQFKFIFWWEWAHRFLGRMIGFVFALPFVYFVLTRRISRATMPAILSLFVLGGLQGALGWYMVKSGLSERVEVSQYRLAAHLAMAVFVFAAILWTAFRLSPDARSDVRSNSGGLVQRWGSRALVGLIFLQIMLGALVAGLKAGLAYNTWPLMDGQFIPDGLGIMTPWYLNPFENALTVQFDHRMLAYGIAALVVMHGLWVMRSAVDVRIRRSAVLLLLAVALQVALGIATLLAHVPLGLALTHQAFAVILFALALWHSFLMGRAGQGEQGHAAAVAL